MFADISGSSMFSLMMAAVLGALIGLEREVHGRPAGFRTHLLVSLGSCLFVQVSIHFHLLYGNFSGSGPIGADPGRIAAQVVTGIGFLGAGAIIREGTSVRGLTTAACLWVVAAVGLASGAKMYGTAVTVTLLSLLSLLLLKKLEELFRKDSYLNVRVFTVNSPGILEQIELTVAHCKIAIIHITADKDIEHSRVRFDLQVRHRGKNIPCDLFAALEKIDGVKRISTK